MSPSNPGTLTPPTFSLARSSSKRPWISRFQPSCMEWKESRGISRRTWASSASNCCRMEAKSGLRWGSCAQQSGDTAWSGDRIRRGLWVALSLTLPHRPLTGHELCEGLGAGGWDGQCELVNSHSVGYSKAVDATVGHLSSQQFPQ